MQMKIRSAHFVRFFHGANDSIRNLWFGSPLKRTASVRYALPMTDGICWTKSRLSLCWSKWLGYKIHTYGNIYFFFLLLLLFFFFGHRCCGVIFLAWQHNSLSPSQFTSRQTQRGLEFFLLGGRRVMGRGRGEGVGVIFFLSWAHFFRPSFPAHFFKPRFPAYFFKTRFPAHFFRPRFPAHFFRPRFPAHFFQPRFPTHFFKPSFPVHFFRPRFLANFLRRRFSAHFFKHCFPTNFLQTLP